jgi:hypothetical protein
MTDRNKAAVEALRRQEAMPARIREELLLALLGRSLRGGGLDAWQRFPWRPPGIIGKTVSVNRKPNRLVLVFVYISVVHAPATALTWRDLRDRPAAHVRGSKRISRVASALNTTGSVAYWLFGRRPTAQP